MAQPQQQPPPPPPQGFDPSQPAPTLTEYQNDFQPTVADINAVHGAPRTTEEKKQDDKMIRNLEREALTRRWEGAWFECKDLTKYHVNNPETEFLRIARRYDNVVNVMRLNRHYGYTLKKQANKANLRMPPQARINQAVNGDLMASNPRRRQHLIQLIAYCWQLRQICEEQKQWEERQSAKRRVKREQEAKKKKKEKDKKKEKEAKKGGKGSKSKTGKKGKEEEEEKEVEEEEEELKNDEPEEPNPYDWGHTSPEKMYNAYSDFLIAVYFLCLSGLEAPDELDIDSYYQRKYDATHVFANHMAKLCLLKSSDGKPLFSMVLNLVCSGNTAQTFMFTHHLHSCINFESKHSSQSLREQAIHLEKTLEDLPPTSSKRLQKLAQLQQITKELQTVGGYNDGCIKSMKFRAEQVRMIDPKEKPPRYKPYPDHVYLRVQHELSLQEAIKPLESWGITPEDFNRIWQKIDNEELNNNLRRIICGSVSYQAKSATAMDIDHHKLGIGADYIKKKYQNLLEAYNKQRQENQIYHDQVANLLETNTDFLNHYGAQEYNTNTDDKAHEISNLKEDEINTTMFAHKYLTGQFTADEEEKKDENVEREEEKKQEEVLGGDNNTAQQPEIVPIGPMPDKPEEVKPIEKLPTHPAKLQALLRRKERMLVGMTKQYGLKEEEVKKMLELTDGRAAALTPQEFHKFYGNQPIELIQKFMDPNLNQNDRESMSTYFKTILESFKKLQLEKFKIQDPAKYYGSLRNAVHAQHQAAIERIDYTKKKYTDEYFAKIQAEFQDYEKKLIQKKDKERADRKQRLEAIKKLERKKRQRLTTPVTNKNRGARVSKDNLLSPQETEQLAALKEHEAVTEHNLETQKENIQIQQQNEEILDRFFDAEDRKLQKNQTAEAKEERMRGPDDNTDEFGMSGFLNRESMKNYGKIVAGKTDVASAISEQVMHKKAIRIRRRTLSRKLSFGPDQLLQDPYAGASATVSPHDSHRPSPSPYSPNQNDRIQRLLASIVNATDDKIPDDLRQEAKSLLSNQPLGPPPHAPFKSKSPSPMLTAKVPLLHETIDEEEERDDYKDNVVHGVPMGAGAGHYKSNSMIVHDHEDGGFDEETLKQLGDAADASMLHDEHHPHDHHMDDGSSHHDEDDDLKREYDDGFGPQPDNDWKLPFDDIDVVAKDLDWLDTDELVPISHKDMLDASEIAELKVDQVPELDVIAGDGIEQRERQHAVDKLEKSYMADAALKKAREKERAEMQKRLEEQKNQMQEAEAKEEKIEVDILKQGGVIRQKKTAEEIAKEYAALSPEEKAKRRQERKERHGYTSNQRNPKLLEKLDNKVEEETIMVETEVDDFELVPIEDTDAGQELADSFAYMREMEEKYGGDIEISDDDMDDVGVVGGGGGVVDRRQLKVFEMDTKSLYDYIVDKTGINEESAVKIIDHGLNGMVIETAIMDNDLDAILKDVGFEFVEIGKLMKILKFDGWKMKESYPMTMSTQKLADWVEKNVGKKMVEAIVNNAIDGKTVGLCIEDGGNELNEMLIDAGVDDEKQIESLRSQFVLDSNMVPFWDLSDVGKWLKLKLKSVKTIDNVISTLTNNGVNGAKLLALLQPNAAADLTQMGIDQATQSRIRGKMKLICRHIDSMDEVEVMFWLHSIPIDYNAQIAAQLHQKKVTGPQLMKQKDLKTFLRSKVDKAIPDHVIERVTAAIRQTMDEHGGFVPNYLIQDPNIMDFNESTASKQGGKKVFASEQEKREYEEEKAAKRAKKLAAKRDKVKQAKRRHSRVASKIELSQAIVVKDGRRFMRVYKGKKKVKAAQKIKNFSKKTITLQKAKNAEQAKIRMARKQKYDKRRAEKQEMHRRVSSVVAHQLEHGIDEANEMIGIHGDESDDMVTDPDYDSELTDSEEALNEKIMMTHKSKMSQTRLVEKMEFVGGPEAGGDFLDDAKHEMDSNTLNIPDGRRKSKTMGRVTMAGHALEDFVAGGNKALFHKRRASSIVQRIVAKSQDDLKNFHMRRGSRRMSRKSLSRMSLGGGGVRHSRQFSSGHFVTQFFKNATDREKIEAGMRGEAPLIVYYCDKDEMTEQIKDIYQTSVLDTYIDDYSTFDDYIKILSMRLEHAQKKHRTEMDELRRNKEDLTNEVDALRTKKEELIRLIGQERSLFKRELPALAKAKADARASEDQYEAAENVIKDKFNETKLHVMMMMQFRDNHLRKLNEEKTKNSDIKAKIQVLQGDIEELLSHYFTLQNAHNKLEHTVALLSELTTLCHEVNVRKKAEYEREIKDLLAMIERYRCRIRNVDRLIEQYKKEVVELRMLHEKRSAEFKKIQKNPTTNRTAATIDYYVAQRKLYEQKAEKQTDTFDNFISMVQKYAKETGQKQQALKHYDVRSNLANQSYTSAVYKKNQVYRDCRELCKVLNISWKQAEKEFIEKGNELAQQFQNQFNAMNTFEQDSKPYGYEFVDAPPTASKQELHTAYDPVLVNKTHDQLLQEQEYLAQGQLDRVQPDIITDPTNDLPGFKKTVASKTFEPNGGNEQLTEQTATQMAVLHRGDPNLDTWRSPGIHNMDEYPDTALQQTFQQVDAVYYNKHGQMPQPLVNIESSYIEEGPDEDEDDMQSHPKLPRNKSSKKRAGSQRKKRRRSKKREKSLGSAQDVANLGTTQSVHFRDEHGSNLESTEPISRP